jgi:hypothetical protein
MQLSFFKTLTKLEVLVDIHVSNKLQIDYKKEERKFIKS